MFINFLYLKLLFHIYVEKNFLYATLREKEGSCSNYSFIVKAVAVALTVFLVGTNIIIVRGTTQHPTVNCSLFEGQLKLHNYFQCNS